MFDSPKRFRFFVLLASTLLSCLVLCHGVPAFGDIEYTGRLDGELVPNTEEVDQ